MSYKYKHKRLEGFKNYVIKKPHFLSEVFGTIYFFTELLVPRYYLKLMLK